MTESRKLLDTAISTLEREGYTCVLTDGKSFYTSRSRGVKPLVAFIESGEIPAGLYAADKVVGKATAYLYVILKLRELYASVISEPAISVLNYHGISVRYGMIVKNIINRQGDGICPFEEAVLNINAPSDAYTSIRKKMNELNINL